MKIARLPMQILAILLQVYFFVQTVFLLVTGHCTYMGELQESSWGSMLYTLLIVIGCEMVSLPEAILQIKSTRGAYRRVYFFAMIGNAMLFLSLAYYTVPGTVLCMISYVVLFVLRIINLVRNSLDIADPRRNVNDERWEQHVSYYA